MATVVDRRTSADDEELRRELLAMRKRTTDQLIATAWDEQDGWIVYVRDGQGGEFCRRKYKTGREASDGEADLRHRLATCNGDILTALSDWSGYVVQVPLWWADKCR